MASALYKEHLIVSSAKLVDSAPVGKTWCASVLISWRTEVTQRNFHQLKPGQRFEQALEAELFGIELAKAWIEGRM